MFFFASLKGNDSIKETRIGLRYNSVIKMIHVKGRTGR